MCKSLLWVLFFWCAGGAVVLSLILVQRRVLAWRAWRDRCMAEASVVRIQPPGTGRMTTGPSRSSSSPAPISMGDSHRRTGF